MLMKKIIIKLTFLSLLSTGVFASWINSTHIDEFTNVKSELKYSYSENTTRNSIRPIIFVVKTSDWKQTVHLSTNHYSLETNRILVKFGKDNPVWYNVSRSSDDTALFIKDTRSFISEMKSHRKMSIRFTPYRENTLTVKFSLEGFSNSKFNRPKYSLPKEPIRKEAVSTRQRIASVTKHEATLSKYVVEVPLSQQYPNSPQIITSKLHIYNVTEIDKFRDTNKLMITSSSGKFAIPSKIIFAAKRLNFTDKLEKKLKMLQYDK